MLHIDTHRQVLYNLIQDIFALPYAQHIAFKGGTACYFLYGLDRFSTDIDLDIVGLEYDTNIVQDIIALARKYGTVKDKQHIVLSYQLWAEHIKIDINRKPRKSNTYEIINFYGRDITVQTQSTIFANKLVACAERCLNRDIYDIYFMMKHNFPINEAIILERTWASLYVLYVLLHKHLSLLGSSHKILDGLGEVLDDTQKNNVKHKLIQDILWLLKFKIDGMTPKS